VYDPTFAPNPQGAPVPPPPPPTEEAPEPASAPRYPYLVSRLRNRQITMEEATELFDIQRQQVRVLMARTNALTAASVRAPMPPPPPPVARSGAPVADSVAGLDPWGEGLLFLALGAGLLAALAKRAQSGAPVSPSGRTTASPANPPRP
jgi:hypothetical protein